jgi:hypothetical protein
VIFIFVNKGEKWNVLQSIENIYYDKIVFRVIHMVKFVESLVGDRRKKTEQGKISMDI